jgi:hypothetical protein
MRVHTATVPSAFQPLDSQSSAADAFANCRDMQTLRSNHNALLARRIQQTILTQAFSTDGASSDTPLTFISRRSIEDGHGPLIVRNTIYVPQMTRRLRLKVVACRSALNGDSDFDGHPFIYAALWNTYARKQKGVGVSVDVAAVHGVPTAYTIDMNLPTVTAMDNLHYGRRQFQFGMWVQCQVDNTRTDATGLAITNPEGNAVSASTSGNAHRFLYFGTDLEVAARMVSKEIALGGGISKMVTDTPFSRLLDAVADTAVVREILGVDLYSMSLYALAETSFSQEYSI